MVTLVTLEGYLLARIVPMSQEKVPSYHWSISGMPESSMRKYTLLEGVFTPDTWSL